jgi:hypothetical protein
VGPEGAQLALRSGVWRPRYRLLESVVWPAPASDAQRAAALGALLQRHPAAGSALEVLVADLWAPSASVLPPVNAASEADLQAAVALRLRTVTDTATGWELASAPRVGGRFVASALRSGLLDMLRQQCEQHRLHLVSVQPLFAAVWNHWHRALGVGEWLGICNAGVLTLCVAPQRHIEQLRRLEFTPTQAQEPGWLGDAVQRESLRLGVAPPDTLALCGEVPRPWREALPAATARRGPAVSYLGAVCDAPSLWGVQR